MPPFLNHSSPIESRMGNTMTIHPALDQSRHVAIDRFRGALVVLMVAGNFAAGVNVIPAFFKHAPDIGFTIADPVASAFVFTIGLTYSHSFARRSAEARPGAYRHFVMRYLALIGIGAIITAGSNLTGRPSTWGVLQAIGVAGLITLLFIRLPAWSRFVIGAVILAGYQWILDLGMLDAVLRSDHGGLFGSISWSALLILATAVADIWRRGTLRYAICCAVLVVAAGISLLIVPVSKNRVSLSFILVTLALSALVFFAVDAISRVRVARAGLIAWWGENALALYVLHLLLLGAVVAPAFTWWYVEAPLWLAVIQLTVILGLLSVTVWWMHTRGKSLRL